MALFDERSIEVLERCCQNLKITLCRELTDVKLLDALQRLSLTLSYTQKKAVSDLGEWCGDISLDLMFAIIRVVHMPQRPFSKYYTRLLLEYIKQTEAQTAIDSDVRKMMTVAMRKFASLLQSLGITLQPIAILTSSIEYLVRNRTSASIETTFTQSVNDILMANKISAYISSESDISHKIMDIFIYNNKTLCPTLSFPPGFNVFRADENPGSDPIMYIVLEGSMNAYDVHTDRVISQCNKYDVVGEIVCLELASTRTATVTAGEHGVTVMSISKSNVESIFVDVWTCLLDRIRVIAKKRMENTFETAGAKKPLLPNFASFHSLARMISGNINLTTTGGVTGAMAIPVPVGGHIVGVGRFATSPSSSSHSMSVRSDVVSPAPVGHDHDDVHGIDAEVVESQVFESQTLDEMQLLWQNSSIMKTEESPDDSNKRQSKIFTTKTDSVSSSSAIVDKTVENGHKSEHKDEQQDTLYIEKIKELEQQLATAQYRIDDLVHTNDDLVRKNTQLITDAQTLAETNKLQLDELEKVNETLRHDIEISRAEIATSQVLMHDYSEENNKLKQKISELDKQVESLSTQNTETCNNLAASTAEVQRLTKVIEDINDKQKNASDSTSVKSVDHLNSVLWEWNWPIFYREFMPIKIKLLENGGHVGTMASDVFDNIISAGVPCDEWNTYIESTLSKSLDKEQ